MKNIEVAKRTVIELFANKQYSIDYYQREYRWERRHVAQLLDDLIGTFFDSWKPQHAREEVSDYEGYFLGPVIVTRRGFSTDIVDGQQCLTTLSLIFLALRRRDDVIDESQQNTLLSLVTTTIMDKHDFTLAVEERRSCMEAILSGKEGEILSTDLSIRNLVDRFADIEELLESGIDPLALSYFADWLMHRVQVVQVMAETEADAYTIFETMNDRGLRLTMPEMLRGYLLSRIDSDVERSSASTAWKESVSRLADFGKEDDVDAIQAWLRGRYAESASLHRQGVDPGDFERIGNEFHRWVRDVEKPRLKLHQPSDFTKFVTRDFDFYICQYARLRRCADQDMDGLENVSFITSQGFTLHYMLLLSAVTPEDSEEILIRKFRAVAAYVDILIHRRLWNGTRITQTVLRYPLFEMAKSLRRAGSIEEVVSILTEAADDDNLSFSGASKLRRNQRNSKTVRRILARLTLYVEQGSTKHLRYRDLIETGLGGYDIEHVIPDEFERYLSDWSEQPAFGEERSWIGGLLLLPSRVNRAIGKKRYSEKVDLYLKENRLAASLNALAYKSDPAFRSFRDTSKLPFVPYAQFAKNELYKRQYLYEQIAEQVWSPNRIGKEAGL